MKFQIKIGMDSKNVNKSCVMCDSLAYCGGGGGRGIFKHKITSVREITLNN